MQQEGLRALVKDKLLALLPAVSLQALLGYAVPGEMGRELEEYGEVLVAAQEAARVAELLRALGAGADELRNVSRVWGIAIRNASGRTRAVQSVRSELRGACMRFLKETPVSDALGEAEQGMTVSARNSSISGRETLRLRRRVLCWKVYLRIDRAYGRRARTQGLAGNKVGEVCSRKSFGRWWRRRRPE